MVKAWAEDRRWVLGFALCLALLTSLPYLLALANQDTEWVFSGFIFGVEDGHSYIAKMMRGAQGEWLFRSPYSTLEQGGALVYLPYLLLGKFIGPSASHSQLVWGFHLFRIASIAFLCLALYDFAALFLDSRWLRRLLLALATLGGGLGWLLLPLGHTALDFYSPETFGFLSIYGLPHLVLARALLLWALARYLRTDSEAAGWVTGLLWLALSLIHLLTAAIGLLLVITHLALSFRILPEQRGRWRIGLRQGAWALLGAAPVLAFNTYQFMNDTFLQGWARQNLISSPPPWEYLLAYGLPLVLALRGAPRLLRLDRWRASLLVLWLALLPLLLYLPFGLQRRLAEGGWVALLVLALAAFAAAGTGKGWRWLFLLLVPSTALLLMGGLKAAQQPRLRAFLPTGQVAAYQALDEVAEFDQVLLAGYHSGNAAPAWTPLRVVIGHGPETVDLATLAEDVRTFYQAPQANADWLNEWGADYVFVGPAERDLSGGEFDAPERLELIYDEDGYQLYRVSSTD